jgi:hypothetical protein
MAYDNGLVTDLTASEPALYGVLSPAASVVTDTSSDWARGVEFETLNCATNIRLSAICSTASSVEVVEAVDGRLYSKYMPFAIETDFQCSTFGFEHRDYEGVARDFMEAAQQKAIERELWTGASAKLQSAVWNSGQHGGDAFPNRWLASPSAVDVTPTPGTAVKVKYGLALLEAALGTCGAGIRGTIHATRGVASVLNLKDKNGALRTSLGNTVIAGAGYTGSAPNGTAPTGTQVWMYATGPVSVRLGPITATPDQRRQSVDLSNNTVKVYATRPAAVSWDSCCHYGVLVDLALDYA